MIKIDSNGTRFTYLVADDRDRQWGIYVNTVGFESIPPHTPYPHAGHPEGYAFDIKKGRVISEYQLKYVVRGRGILQTASMSQTLLNPGDFFLICPGEWHTYWPEQETGWDSYWIGFEGDIINRWVANGFFSRRHPLVHVGFRDQVVSLFQHALNVAFAERRGHQQMLSGVAEVLCSNFCYSQQRQQAEDTQKTLSGEALVVIDGRRLIRNHLEEDISIQEIASQLGVSYSYFRKYFKRYTGYSPSYYQQFLRLQMAKEVLQNTNASVAEVAYRFQFTSPDYFSFRFREVLGVSPSSFKRKPGLGDNT